MEDITTFITVMVATTLVGLGVLLSPVITSYLFHNDQKLKELFSEDQDARRGEDNALYFTSRHITPLHFTSLHFTSLLNMTKMSMPVKARGNQKMTKGNNIEEKML